MKFLTLLAVALAAIYFVMQKKADHELKDVPWDGLSESRNKTSLDVVDEFKNRDKIAAQEEKERLAGMTAWERQAEKAKKRLEK